MFWEVPIKLKQKFIFIIKEAVFKNSLFFFKHLPTEKIIYLFLAQIFQYK